MIKLTTRYPIFYNSLIGNHTKKENLFALLIFWLDYMYSIFHRCKNVFFFFSFCISCLSLSYAYLYECIFLCKISCVSARIFYLSICVFDSLCYLFVRTLSSFIAFVGFCLCNFLGYCSAYLCIFFFDLLC